MKSIKWKLTAMYLGLVLIVMIASGTFILLSLQSIEVEKAKTQLELYAEKIKEQVVLSDYEKDFQKGINKFSQTSTAMQVSILNAEGKTIASTVVDKSNMPEYKDSVVISAMAHMPAFGSGKRNVDSSGLVKEWINYATPVPPEGELKYIIYTEIDSSAMNESLNQTRKTIGVAVMLALLLTSLMGFVFAKTLTEPITALTIKAKELAQGKLDQKIKVRSADEIGQLTDSFNYMSSELSKTMSEISKEKNKLEIILHNMTDGVISFNKTGELMHVNTATLEMLDIDNFEMSFLEFIKAFDINSKVYLDTDPESSKQAIFAVGKNFIKSSFSPYFNSKNEMEGLVVVLQDITEQKKLDDMRKEFVANVSHELRTPLTTVKSYTETLIDGAIDQKDIAMEFLSIIDSEADRMAFLVRDLLQLSRFDSKQVQLSMDSIDVNDIISENIRQSKIHAEHKNQTILFEPYSKDIFITGDRDRITQVINNILTNAIKYSLTGAEIKTFVTEDEKYYKISIKDTGMGIQREDLPRIFERFYRVDKARSRAMGGTGLGLAIAKEIMESHHGKITVESEYGKGTLMTLCFLKQTII